MDFDKGLKDLRDKRMLPLDFDKVSKVEITGPKLNLTLAFADGKWTVQNPKDLRADSSTLSGVVEKFQAATMDAGASDADMKKSASLFSSGNPVATVKVTDPSGSSGDADSKEQGGLLREVDCHGWRV